jgi:hypothetical protein
MSKMNRGMRKQLHKLIISVILVVAVFASFVAGTAVVMASGATKAIEDIKVGDYVKSYNESTGQVENKRVLQTFENTVTELTKITTSDGQEIVATPGHKFFANGAWISAEDLRAGDILVNVNGQKVVVEAIQHEILEKPVKVYNFEVQDNHTYFVGSENGIVVHNTACGGATKAFNSDQQAVIDLAKSSQKTGLSADDASTLWKWAQEYGISGHEVMTHPNQSGIWSFTKHIKIKNYHIKVW